MPIAAVARPVQAATRARWPTTTSTRCVWAGCRPPALQPQPLELAAEAAAWARPTGERVENRRAAEGPAALDVAFADPDNLVNWPRNLIVWRANLIGTSAKGHEYFLKHLLGAQNGVMQEGGEGGCLHPGEVARGNARPASST